ncbi:MAG: tetratricopeptide repeat protein [Hyphomicrobiaceae bacterium]|nr:tetratricopeptide repeat protein [Hyphomicrobiaceae bacterium]
MAAIPATETQAQQTAAQRPEQPPSASRDGAAALIRGDTKEAVSFYTSALEDPTVPKDRRALIYNDRAVAYARLGQTRLAFEDFNRAVQLFPENAAVYNNRGNLLLALGHAKEATKDFDRALALAPGYAAAYNNRAGAYLSSGEFQAAIRDYTQAVKLLPNGAAPLSGRGTALLELGRPHAAIRDFTRAVSSDESFASGYHQRAQAKMVVGHYDEAIEDLSRAIAFDLKNASLYLLRGRAYLANDNSEAAVKDLTRAVELKPGDANAHAELGLAHARGGVTEEALADLARAIEIDPRSARAFAYRAFVYKEADQTDVGTKDIATAVKIAPDAPEVLWAKAEIADALGQRDEALADVRRAVFLDPAMKPAADLLDRLEGAGGRPEEAAIPGLEFGVWRVVLRGKRYFAVSPAFPRLSVPLELAGEGEPRLIGFEERPPPLKHIGVLTFSGGKIATPTGTEETEFAAVLDLGTSSVIAIEPHRQGSRVATWTWADDRVNVAAVDGVTDQLVLRGGRDPAVARRSSDRRYTASGYDERYGYEQPWGGPQYAPQPRREARPARRKPKTLFELLFN